MKILEDILKELKANNQAINELKNYFVKESVEYFTRDEALDQLGLKNRGYLHYYTKIGVLTSRKGKNKIIYPKDSVRRLKQAIDEGKVEIPPTKKCYE